MNRHDAYYEPEDNDEGEQLDERIYDLVAHNPEYDPANMMNMSEAIGQESDDEVVQQFIKDCVIAKDWAKLGLKLYQLSWDYQESIAEYRLTK